MDMQPTLIYIDIERYKEITQCDDTFDGTAEWDCNHGICIEPNATADHTFKFRVIDDKKYMLAKIKYGI